MEVLLPKMKKLLSVALILVAIASAHAYKGLTFLWDPNPSHEAVTNYIITVTTDLTNFNRGTNPVVGVWTQYNTGPITGLVAVVAGLDVTLTNTFTNFHKVDFPWGTNDVPPRFFAAVQAQNMFAESDYSNTITVSNIPGRVNGFRVFNMSKPSEPMVTLKLPPTRDFDIEWSPKVEGPWLQAMGVRDLNTNLMSKAMSWYIDPDPLFSMEFWRLNTNNLAN